MAAAPVQAPSGPGQHLVLYDGVCGLCTRAVQFLLRHDHRAVFMFASLQSDAGRSVVERCGGNARELTTFYVVPDYRKAQAPALGKSAAVLFVASELGWPWKAGVLLRVFPRAVRDVVYDAIARSRYRVFGRLDHCLMPGPDVRQRFIGE